MLDQLVESRSNSQNQKSRGGYLFTTGFLVFSLFASGIMWSLFAQNLDIGGDALELSSIVPPVPMPDDVLPAPEPVLPTKQVSAPKQKDDNIFVRTENVASTSEPIAPKTVSTSPSNQISRPNVPFKIGEENSNPSSATFGASRDGVGSNNVGGPIGVSKPKVIDNDKEEEPPVVKKPEPQVEKPAKPTAPISGGVMNGKAISLPIPAYPPPARAIGATGDVNVQVTIDEDGKVISAKAITGHALLRSAAENAARGAKFSPTYLSKVPVKVTGIIVYKFSK